MPIKPALFQELVLAWYDLHGRKHLPWQKNISPYTTWLSEIMLQQTQVSTVIPYFEKFIARFPTIAKLAAANIDTVLHLWTGLGYYARARNLHACAKIITEKYNNHFPKTTEELIALPGIGLSTAGAILSLSMKRRAPILDGNVKRVLTRVFCIDGHTALSSTQKKLWALAEEYTPEKKVRTYTQVMMDLGATICTRTKPVCDRCPLQKHCQAFKENRMTEFPHKKPKKKIPAKSTCFLILRNKNNEPLLMLRPPTGIWGGLWSFPECDDFTAIEENLKKQFGFRRITKKRLKPFRHSFSHYHLDITPVLIQSTEIKQQVMESAPVIWYNNQQVGMPQPVVKLLKQINKEPQ